MLASAMAQGAVTSARLWWASAHTIWSRSKWQPSQVCGSAVRRRWPFTCPSFVSKRSKSVRASAPAPAKPASTRSWYRRRTFRAFCFMIVCPTVTCPSPAMTTRPRWRTERMVVERISGPRVRAVIGLHQPAEVDVGVALRRREARVAEQLLDGTQVGAGAEKVRGEGVTKGVRCRLGRRAAGQHVALHQPSDAAGGEPAPTGVAEDRAAARQEAGRDRRVPVESERAEGGPPDRHDAL